MKQTKCKCGSAEFSLFRSRDCSECVSNGVYSPEEDGYIHPLWTEDERTQVKDQCQCNMGESNNEGCVIITCKCGIEVERVFFV